jgi:hypothetical protein
LRGFLFGEVLWRRVWENLFVFCGSYEFYRGVFVGWM